MSISTETLKNTILKSGVNSSNIGYILTIIRDNCSCDETYYLLDLSLKNLSDCLTNKYSRD